eukprot:GILI01041270.1.p2 GENE.GILI01041270.1~~GILI01041270.1.p2  ORF type:complete len:149 (-),score=28.67 GILI01041270.1:91-537(-)
MGDVEDTALLSTSEPSSPHPSFVPPAQSPSASLALRKPNFPPSPSSSPTASSASSSSSLVATHPLQRRAPRPSPPPQPDVPAPVLAPRRPRKPSSRVQSYQTVPAPSTSSSAVSRSGRSVRPRRVLDLAAFVHSVLSHPYFHEDYDCD